MSNGKEFNLFSKTIVAANPSFATGIETLFWNGLDGVCRDRGWRLVKASARAIPEDENTFIIPARLAELAGALGNIDADETVRLPPWIDEDTFFRYIDWEMRRWDYDTADLSNDVARGLSKLTLYIDYIFRQLRPALCLTTNKIDHGTGLFRDAALHYGVSTFVIERSPIDSIWIEPDGIFQESELWSAWPKRASSRDEAWRRQGRKVAIELSRNPEGFRARATGSLQLRAELARLPKPFIFVPMDNVLWTGWAQHGHPQGALDYPLFENPIEAIHHVAGIARDLGGSLRIKIHPACREIRQEDMPRDVEIITGDLASIISECDLVVCFNTKVAFSALALEKPVVTLAHNPIAACGATYHTQDMEGIRPAIEAGIRRKDFDDKLERFYTFLGWSRSDFFYSAQTKLNFVELNQHDLLDRLESSVLEKPVIAMPTDKRMDNIRDLLKSHSKWRFPKSAPTRVAVDFDVTRLANLKIRNSGITRYSAELLAYFKHHFRDLRAVVFDRKRTEDLFGGSLKAFGEYLEIEVSEATGSMLDRVLFSPYGPLPSPGDVSYGARVLTMHDVFHLTRQAYYFAHKGEYTGNIIRSVGADDYIVCVSTYTMRDVVDLLSTKPERTFVVPLGASEIFLRRDETGAAWRRKYDLEDQKYFVVWCQPDHRKNTPGTVLAAVAALDHIDDPSLSAVFIADPTSIDSLRELIVHADGDLSRTRFVSGLMDEELAALYHGARFMVFTPFLEGFGLPLIEAMSTGCPVITSASSSLTEVGGDACLYTDPWDPPTIADAIVSLANNSSLRDILARRSPRRAGLFSWVRTSKSTAGVVEEAARSLRQEPARSAPAFGPAGAARLLQLGEIDAADVRFDQALAGMPDGECEKVGIATYVHDEGAGFPGEEIFRESMDANRHGLVWRLEDAEAADHLLLFECVLRPVGRRLADIRIELDHGTEKELILDASVDVELGQMIRKDGSAIQGARSFASVLDDGRVHCVACAPTGTRSGTITIQILGRRFADGPVEYQGEGRLVFGLSKARVSLLRLDPHTPRSRPARKHNAESGSRHAIDRKPPRAG
ncbi:MAG: glycosyltransferase [Bauldia sp.]|uniref:glycosyltransferase n=1 Tax=Bauldia sp. TaxID=2575872 RepID=UPI001DA472C9|nr:glycosyltransferase [Bauldia sp.]MCB1498076.1 glycosyltransferase [Bauldia sp.]